MPALPCKALQGQILGTAPWFDGNSPYADVIGNDEGIKPIILAEPGE